MRAAYVAALALLLLVAGRWAHDEPAFDVQTVAGAIVVLVTVAALDHGSTEPVAKGIAWIILAVVALSDNSPVTAIAHLVNSKAAASTTSTGSTGGTRPAMV